MEDNRSDRNIDKSRYEVYAQSTKANKNDWNCRFTYVAYIVSRNAYASYIPSSLPKAGISANFRTKI